MESQCAQVIPSKFFDGIHSFIRQIIFQVLAIGQMPQHISFIPDGNRRYGRKVKLQEGEAHHMGFFTLISILKYCYEMGIQYVSVYAFSIDNFKRKPDEVQVLMKLIRDNTTALLQEDSTLNRLGVRIVFLGNLKLLDATTRETVRLAMDTTVKNTKLVLLVCLAYSSTDEIVHGVQSSCEDEWARARAGSSDGEILKEDLEKHMYFAGYPDPDILIRSSGETRLSNFVLWQSSGCLLYAPKCLWPEMSLRHLIWAVILYQRNYAYLVKKNDICLEFSLNHLILK